MNKSFQAVVYDDFAGFPVVANYLGNRWWVTTPGEMLQPLEDYFGGEDVDFRFLCEAGGTVGALALAQMLGKAVEEPEDSLDEVLRHRVENLKRLGVTLDVQDEPLVLELEVFSNEGLSHRQGKFSVWCYAKGRCCEQLFDTDGFDYKQDAEEWAGCYFDFLKELGIELNVEHNNR